MKEEKITVTAADGEAEAILYSPGSGKYPGVLDYTDLFGIRPASQSMGQRVAAAGYTVMMPNVFYRHGKLPLLDFEFTMGEERSMQKMAPCSIRSMAR
jgi:carboxymethylenebutenolidase